MKKLFLTIFAALLLCSSLQAQIIVPNGHSPRRGYTHSKTIVTVNRVGEFHGFADVSVGLHVWSGQYAINPMTNFSAGLVYEYSDGFMLGVASGMGFKREYDYSHPYEDKYAHTYSEIRPMAVLGYRFNTGPGSLFFMFNPGFSLEDGKDGFEFGSFSGDIKIGYSYMIRKHFGLALSTGMSGSFDSWMSIPITLGLVF